MTRQMGAVRSLALPPKASSSLGGPRPGTQNLGNSGSELAWNPPPGGPRRRRRRFAPLFPHARSVAPPAQLRRGKLGESNPRNLGSPLGGRIPSPPRGGRESRRRRRPLPGGGQGALGGDHKRGRLSAPSSLVLVLASRVPRPSSSSRSGTTREGALSGALVSRSRSLESLSGIVLRASGDPLPEVKRPVRLTPHRDPQRPSVLRRQRVKGRTDVL
jgi:hypothetical protein